MKYFCCDENRREAVKNSSINGIDFLEVLDEPTQPLSQRQRTLYVHFVKPLATSGPTKLAKKNVLIEGGERVRNVAVQSVTIGTGDQDKVLTVKVDRAGDFSIHTLRLVKDSLAPHQPPEGFDQILSAVDFSFKVNCPSEFDCLDERVCSTEPAEEPDINYLAKDYASFRQLILDRLAVLMPDWQERSPGDLGIALVELLAYVGDYLSYQQDAIATEAYLGTARRRVSVRRHARLVDYFMHDGCNARAWVQLKVSSDNVTVEKGTQLLTRIAGVNPRISPGSSDYTDALAAGPEVFELMHDATLFQAHNEMTFYTWGARECCLPQGATRATLQGQFPDLNPGDVLILAEVRGPHTGKKEDADPSRRHAVRLTSVTVTEDKIGGQFVEPKHSNPVPVTEIEWHTGDALPFPLCISASQGTAYYGGVSVAWGNIALADHGRTLTDESLGSMPEPTLHWVSTTSADRCQEQTAESIPPRFHPTLKEKPLTQVAPSGGTGPSQSAAAAMRWKLREVLPAIYLNTSAGSTDREWLPRRDLLNSGRNVKEFVVEVETDGTAILRFGDNQHGLRPPSATAFYATYRMGNGKAGNVGAESLVHIVSSDTAITAVRNPLPAEGGVEAETIKQALQNAPSAFRTQERAVTPGDYAAKTELHSQVQQAAATFRWTGSWYTAFLTVDRLSGLDVDAAFERSVRNHIERYRMAGHDVEVDGPQFVPLEIEMHVCADPDYFRSDVKTALMEVFSNRTLPDGRLGVFHPDNFTFGQSVYTSKLYAAAQAVEGVASVQIKTFQRQDVDSDVALGKGELELGRLEIARLDNDPNYPKHGVFRVTVGGGK